MNEIRLPNSPSSSPTLTGTIALRPVVSASPAHPPPEDTR